MDEVERIIRHLGGTDSTAGLFGISPDAIRKWRVNGVPTKHWAAIVRITKGRITYRDLEAARPERSVA